jgi:hypothetical protein
MDVSPTPDLTHSGSIGHEPAKHVVKGRPDVAGGSCELLPGAVEVLRGNDRLASYALNRAATQADVTLALHAARIGSDDLPFEARASSVDDENVHILTAA